MTVTLRPAAEGDAERLLTWRNDPETRRRAFTTEEVSPDEHRAWLARRLADPATALFIAEDDGEPVGQVRLDREAGNVGVVSIAVAPEARGRGLASVLLDALAAHPGLGVSRLRAEVKPDNERSLRAFVRSGYREVGRDERAVVLERTLEGRL